MLRPFDAFVARVDSVYAEHAHFTRLKARLLAAFDLLLFIWIPINILKVLWVQPPSIWIRLPLNVVMIVAAAWSLSRLLRGHLAQAGNGLALGLMLPIHASAYFFTNYLEPLGTALQLLVYDLVFLLLTLIFASRTVALAMFAVVSATIAWMYFHQLHAPPISGSLEFAADTLVRDGLLAVFLIFCLGLTLIRMIEAANRSSDQALRATQAMKADLERLVAERTRELEVATRQAQESSRAKGEFLANMSHEIRTPLNGVIASADLLRHRDDLPPDAAEQVRLVADSGDLLLRLLGDILDLSKIEAGQLALEQHPFELASLVADTRALLVSRAESSGVQLTCTVSPDLPPHLLGDSFRLRQILLNLTANGVKFTPAGGAVHVTAASPAPDAEPVQVRFEVRDTGIGMDAAAVGKIFERFTQADSSTTRRFGGSGLGLAISSQLVRLMGGTLAVESEPGRGSAFSFTLAFPRAELSSEDATSHDDAAIRLGLHVFVAEDNPVNRKILAAQLERLGCRHTMACDGQEALEMLTQIPPPDLVLMDCHMPRLDGWETTRRIRAWSRETDEAHRKLAELPIIALTAAALPEERQRCADAGMTGFLAKPTRLGELAATVQRATSPAAPRGSSSRPGIR